MRRLSALGCGLAAAVLASQCSAAGARANPEPRAESREPVVITISNFQFAPSELSVDVGDTIVWVNRDGFTHTSTADSAAWSSPELSVGERFRYVAKAPGRYRYHCAAHPVMTGVVTVVTGNR